MELREPFRKDKNGLWYIEAKDVILRDLNIKQVLSKDHRPAHFLSIDGVDKYIVKDCSIYGIRFNKYSNLRLLKRLTSKQPFVTDTDFPIGYCLDDSCFKGLIIPYYEISKSIKELLKEYTFADLIDYYYRSDNEIVNLICLFLDMLKKLENMYNQGIYYLDVKPSNFLICNNEVKIIDFEPSRVLFRNKEENLKYLLYNYVVTINEIIREYHFKEIYLHAGWDFYDTESNVKALGKRLER